MNKFLYKIIFYVFLFFLLIKNIYYINNKKFENILFFFITYIFCHFFIDNNLIKISLCIIIPDILFTKKYIYNIETMNNGVNSMVELQEEIQTKGEEGVEKHNEENEEKLNEQSEETDEDNVDKHGFDPEGNTDGEEKEEEANDLINF